MVLYWIVGRASLEKVVVSNRISTLCAIEPNLPTLRRKPLNHFTQSRVREVVAMAIVKNSLFKYMSFV